MNKQTAIQVFAVLAVIVGLGVSYFPPDVNAVEIFSLVSFFLGTAMRELLGILISTPPSASVTDLVPGSLSMDRWNVDGMPLSRPSPSPDTLSQPQQGNQNV